MGIDGGARARRRRGSSEETWSESSSWSIVRWSRRRFVAHPRIGDSWQGLLLVALGWAGVALANVATGIAGDPSSGKVILVTGAVALVSLAAVLGGVVVALTAASSPIRHVFRSGAATRTAAILLLASMGAGTLLIGRAPFEGIATHGRPLPMLIVDLTWLAGLAICIVGGGLGVAEAVRARRDERAWWQAR